MKKQAKILKIKSLLPIVAILCFVIAYLLPGRGGNETINTTLGIIGLLFAILIGFFINDLYSRFQRIRENVAIEVSGLQTYYLFVKILSSFPQHKKWGETQKELIDKYVTEFFKVEWTDYGKIDPHFNNIILSSREISELKTNKETETYTNFLPLLNEITTGREKLFMYGKDRLSKAEWTVIGFLAAILIFSIFYINTATLPSIFLTGSLATSIITLLLILRDLDNLSFGEETVSFEPYETIFDVIGKPRFYLKRDIQSGRVKPPKNKKYRTG